MNCTIQKKSAQSAQAMLEAVHESASADSLAVYRLFNLVKLAAFVCEARCTLDGVYDTLAFQPATNEFIGEKVSYSTNWANFEDVTGHVLQDVAEQLDKMSEVVSNRLLERQELEGADHEL